MIVVVGELAAFVYVVCVGMGVNWFGFDEAGGVDVG